MNIDFCGFRSESHYDTRNHQRKIEYPKEIQIDKFKAENENLIINWKDGHSSNFSITNLQSLFSENGRSHKIVDPQIRFSPKLWNSQNCPINQAKVDFNSYMNSVTGLYSAINFIWTYGFCIITNTPLSIENGTKCIAQRIGPRFQGPEDEFWVLKGSPTTPDTLSDTAYLSIALDPHTDGTFFSTAPG